MIMGFLFVKTNLMTSQMISRLCYANEGYLVSNMNLLRTTKLQKHRRLVSLGLKSKNSYSLSL
jgi:hypothetical protein